MKRGTFQRMKSINKSIIMNEIRTQGPISRAEIAKKTKLTPPTVSSNVKELIEENLVRESAIGESSGGRKPTMLLINYDAYYVIGVDAGPNSVECMLANLSGEALFKTSDQLTEKLSNDQFLAILKKNIQEIINQVKDKNKIIGIGVAMHGVVDVKQGIAIHAPNLHLHKIPIKKELEVEYGMTVHVENDARAMAFGESWFGSTIEASSLVAINLGSGVGAGIVMNGKLYHGAQHIAGEIGHMTIDIHGELCECGNHGCLQTFVSGPSIVRRAKKLLVEENASRLEVEHITGEEVYRLASKGDDLMVQVLEDTGMYLGIALVNLIHIFNPEIIIIGGGVAKAEKLLLPTLKKTIENRVLTEKAKHTPVVISQKGKDATLVGVIALVLKELFEPR